MTIIASAKVPAGNRLIDADTMPLPRPRHLQAVITAEHCPTCGEVFHPERPGAGEQCRRCAYDAALVERAAKSNPEGVHQLAEAIRTGCPPWCTSNHAGEVAGVDGFTIGQVHEQIVTELPAADPAYLNRAATAVVLVERSDEAGEVITPTRLILAVAEGPEGAHPGEQDVQGWTGTPEQARALAAALLAAAELVDQQ